MENENLNQNADTSLVSDRDNKFPVLSNYADILKYLGYLTLAITVIAAYLYYTGNNTSKDSWVFILGGIIAGFGLLISSELMRLLLAIEKNTRSKNNV